jgi:hypothetical protein
VTADASPGSGPQAGGTSITVRGTGFLAGASVTVGGNSCTSVSVVSQAEITCTTPASASNGQKAIVVTNSDGQSGTRNNGFRYN